MTTYTHLFPWARINATGERILVTLEYPDHVAGLVADSTGKNHYRECTKSELTPLPDIPFDE